MEKSLTISIDGEWSAADFAALFSALASLYTHYASIEHRIWVNENESQNVKYQFSTGLMTEQSQEAYWPPKQTTKREVSPYLADDGSIVQLAVLRCQYASPGGIDFVGIGAAIGHVKDLLSRVFETCISARERSLKNDRLESENRAVELKNLEHEIELLQKSGFSKDEIKDRVQERLGCANVVAKLIGASLVVDIEPTRESSPSNDEWTP